MSRMPLLVGICLMGVVSTLAQAPVAKTAEDATTSADVREMLQTKFEVPEDFGSPVQMRLIFKLLSDKVASREKTLVFWVDQNSFTKQFENAPDVLDTAVVLRPIAGGATLSKWLDIALNQFAQYHATYLVRDGIIEITTLESALAELLLKDRVALHLRDVTLQAAIDAIIDKTGATIVVDPNCREILSQRVTLETHNDISPRGILESWADLYRLKLVVEKHRVMVSSRGKPVKTNRDNSTTPPSAVRVSLQQRVAVPDKLKQYQPFGELLKFIEKELKEKEKPLEIVVDQKAFQNLYDGMLDISKAEVTMPPFMRSATVQQMLEIALAQIRPGEVIFVLKNNRVEVIPRPKSLIAHLLDQKYSFEFKDVPIRTALRELGDRAGITFFVDPSLEGTIRLKADGELSIRDIIGEIAKQIDLVPVIDERRIALMSKINHERKLADEKVDTKIKK